MLRSQIGAKACKMVRVGQVILTKQVGEVKLAKVRAQNMKLDTRLMMVNIILFCQTILVHWHCNNQVSNIGNNKLCYYNIDTVNH